MTPIDINFIGGANSRVTDVIANGLGGIAFCCTEEEETIYMSNEDALILAVEIIRCHKIIQKRIKTLENKLKI